MRKAVVLLFVFLLGFSLVTSAWADSDDVKVTMNGSALPFPDAKPYIDNNNRTMVPMRFISEALGAEVTWEPQTKEVTITQGCNTINLQVGHNKALVNGEQLLLDARAVIKNNRTMVPLRFVSEVLGAKVRWVPEEKTVEISVNKSYTLPTETDLSISMPHGERNSMGIDISILLFLDKDIDKQLTDIENIISSKFGTEIAAEVKAYLAQKRTSANKLTSKRWKTQGYTVEAVSQPGDDTISVVVYEPRG